MRPMKRTHVVAVAPARHHRLRASQLADLPAQTDWLHARILAQVIRQRVPVGMRHDSRIVAMEIDDTVLRVYPEHGDTLISKVPRASHKQLRHKRYGVVRGPTGRAWTARGLSADVAGSHLAAGQA
jgi:hypothetical protein